MTPVTKYFCTNGYITRTGTTATTIRAYLMTAAISASRACSSGSWTVAGSIFADIRISRRKSVSGYSWRLFR